MQVHRALQGVVRMHDELLDVIEPQRKLVNFKESGFSLLECKRAAAVERHDTRALPLQQ